MNTIKLLLICAIIACSQRTGWYDALEFYNYRKNTKKLWLYASLNLISALILGLIIINKG